MKLRLSRLLPTSLLVILSSSLAMASSFTFTTPSGSTQGGQPVNAQAVFTTGLNSVTIDLSNLLTAAQMVTVAQNLSDLSFTLSGTFASGLVNNTNRSYSGTLIDVGALGAVSAGSGSFNGWDFSNSGSTFLLEDLGSLAGPAQTILGGTAGSFTAYSNANGSIVNNDPHNPFLQGIAHFTLGIAGVTAGTNVTAATFSFNTTLGNNIDGVGGSRPAAVPEPATYLMLGGGLLAIAALTRRRLRA